MYKRIMIVVDETEVAEAAVAEGVRLAAGCGASVVFIHVVSPYVLPPRELELAGYQSLQDFEEKITKDSQRLLALATAQAKQAGVDAIAVSASGQDVARCIAERALDERCDLIVIASRGRTAVKRLIQGSVVANLITLAQLPLLVCKKRAHSPGKADDTPAATARKRAPSRRREGSD